VVIVSVDWALPFEGGVTGEVEKAPVVPVGLPLNTKDTWELKPLVEPTVTV